MRQRTHLVIGVVGGMLPGVLHNGAAVHDVPVYTAMLAVGSLLPDIDSPASLLRRRIPLLRALLSRLPMRHRTVTHSLLALVLLGAFVLTAGRPLWWGLVIGYGLHVLADLTTFSGVPLLWPVSGAAFHLLPRGWRVSATGLVDGLLFAAFGTVMLLGTISWLPIWVESWLN